MKVIDLERSQAQLEEILRLAQKELVVLRKADGTTFALSEVDDFAVEVELLRNNPEFLAFLKQLGQEKAAISLEELRKKLA